MMSDKWLIPILFCVAVAPSTSAPAPSQVSSVPFVGCKSDGQAGPFPAPRIPDKTVQIQSASARRLAYYKAEYGYGVLGPRGWNCFGYYGSSGATLVIAPSSAGKLYIASKLTGAAIEVIGRYGGTSGRFTVAQIAARVFPGEREFIKRVMDEGLLPASDFPFGPYPADRLVYKPGGRIVEYETAPHSEGLGTQGELQQNGDSIRGVAMLQLGPSDLSLVLLSVRLPSNMKDLTTQIVQQLERQSE